MLSEMLELSVLATPKLLLTTYSITVYTADCKLQPIALVQLLQEAWFG